MRSATIERKTNETSIAVALHIEGKGNSSIDFPAMFFGHMLANFSKAGSLDLKINAKGDLEVDQHHTIEDTGITLGQAFRKALGDKKGINRAGFFVYPMDESLAMVSLDIGGRPFLQYNTKFRRRFCGGFDSDTLEDFFYGFSIGLGANVVVKATGRSDHHKIEAIFKAFGKATKMACSKDKRLKEYIPSTKGVI
ncbi:MAG TPA: imidazoleglycerol-phosphate dehydratase HisB [Candidatus Diapherotrites archaeon]|uniref:Imidazoleglycerol-phosphate dehydratase n=1 Tax=Candidatus Iainarchaeum sp. TaxID=3101447 RepID=A0A7J4IXS9_9ARCH|nr:imidazoleglycerol-phosphate dehydratase HisB [Candidatus Diapherotrites archaeon]